MRYHPLVLVLTLFLLTNESWAGSTMSTLKSSLSRRPSSSSLSRSSRFEHTSSKNLRFMGYHGTTREGFEVLTSRIHEFRSQPNLELGPGIYTTDDLKTAQHFARPDGVVVEVYVHASEFSRMDYVSNPQVPWVRGAWEKPENQHYLTDYDFLEAQHKIILPKGMEMRSSRQTKFNERAFSKLSFRLHTDE